MRTQVWLLINLIDLPLVSNIYLYYIYFNAIYVQFYSVYVSILCKIYRTECNTIDTSIV